MSDKSDLLQFSETTAEKKIILLEYLHNLNFQVNLAPCRLSLVA